MEKYIFLIVLFSPHSTKYTRIRGLRFNHSPKEMLGWFWYLCLVIRLRKRWSLVGGDSQQGNIVDTGFASTCWFLIPLYIFPGWQFFCKQQPKNPTNKVVIWFPLRLLIWRNLSSNQRLPALHAVILLSVFVIFFNLADVCRLNYSSYLVFFVPVDMSYFW